VNKFRWQALSVALVFSFGLGIISCRKINEATELGGGLIPAVDNINTFDTILEVQTDNRLWMDSTRIYSNDEVALGRISNDPEFGKTHANLYFNIGPRSYQSNPFINRDSIVGIDSAVLTLSMAAIYGDSSSPQTVRVFEVDANSGFRDSVYYTTSAPDFATNGLELGSRTFMPRELRDSVRFIRGRDTSRTFNTLRIRLNTTSGLIPRLTTYTVDNAYRDYPSFYTAVRGLAVKVDENNASNALTYFNLVDSARSKLVVYFRVRAENGRIDTTAANFYHGLFGAGFQTTTGAGVDVKPRGTQANIIRRTPEFNWFTYLNNGIANDDRLYVQADPGSQINITIPGLTGLSNRVVHRAELIVTKLPALEENRFPAPAQMYLARYTGVDTFLAVVDDSLTATLTNGAVSTQLFGGLLRNDNTYQFNLSRHVQNIVTFNRPNEPLRLFAPYNYTVRDARFIGGRRSFYLQPRIANGRVILAGGSHPDPNVRMRLRIVYSRI